MTEIASNLKEEEKAKNDRYLKLVEEELANVAKISQDNVLEETDLPPVILNDKYGNPTPHILIDGAYLVKPEADVILQERKVVVEYQQLEILKKELENYKKVSEKAKK